MTQPEYGPPPQYGPPGYPQQPTPSAPPAPRFADAARIGPDRYALRVRRHTGLLIVGITKGRVVEGSYDECVAAYRAAQTHCALLGWWGIISLVAYNPIAIVGNIRARGHLRELAGR